MDTLRLLLVEDDANTCMTFNQYIDENENITLVNITNNAAQALSDISYYQPDAIILDLELNNGCGTGFDVLTGLSSTGIKPYIVVTTNNSSNTTYEYARHLGADFIMYKQQKDYSEKKVVDFLFAMRSILKKQQKQLIQDVNDSPEYKSKRIHQRIINELNLIGVNQRLKGFNYLVEAIFITIQADSLVPKLCEEVAKNFKKSEASVERAMQTAINNTWTSTDMDTLLKYYTARISINRGTPTLLDFVQFYANKIKYSI